jgi:hypothetical protein
LVSVAMESVQPIRGQFPVVGHVAAPDRRSKPQEGDGGRSTMTKEKDKEEETQ